MLKIQENFKYRLSTGLSTQSQRACIEGKPTTANNTKNRVKN
jgi:hypothetical protein